MKIPAKAWVNYVNGLNRINKAATDKVGEYLNSHPLRGTEDMRGLIDYAYSISTKYGEAAAALACEMYDAIGAGSGEILQPAEPAPTPRYGEVAKTVQGTAKYNNPKLVSNAVGRLVKRTAADTTLNNAERDGAQFAWIPHGDTCSFCIALASRGWQYMSKDARKNGHAEHIHANCDCEYAIRFDKKTNYEGYDPDKYLDMYESAEGKSSQDKINSMRRMKYQENKDRINAQKREAYALNNGHSMKRNNRTTWKGEPKENSIEEIESLRQFASERNIIIDSTFTYFDGDTSIVKDFIEKVDESINKTHNLKSNPVRIRVSYKMDDDDYAITHNSSITINGYAYRNRELLEEDYRNKAKEGWFTPGSTYLDIATHESGHVLVYIDQLKCKGVRETVFGINKFESSKLISEHISEYALKDDQELIAESYVLFSNSSKDPYVLKVMKYCGILK